MRQRQQLLPFIVNAVSQPPTCTSTVSTHTKHKTVWEFPKLGDPKYCSTLNSRILIIRTPKSGTSYFSETPIFPTSHPFMPIVHSGRASGFEVCAKRFRVQGPGRDSYLQALRLKTSILRLVKEKPTSQGSTCMDL